jgi:hypothetical protein
MKEIEWKDGQYGFEYGYVGKIKLFTCYYDTGRPKGESGNKYKLDSTLPQMKSINCKDMDECKEEAKRLFQVFIDYIT